MARQLAEAEEVGPPDVEPRVRQLQDLMAARMAHGELSVTGDNRVWRPVRTEQRGDARVEDAEVGARVRRQRDWQREVEARVDERISASSAAASVLLGVTNVSPNWSSAVPAMAGSRRQAPRRKDSSTCEAAQLCPAAVGSAK